jgi:hypothetical protein
MNGSSAYLSKTVLFSDGNILFINKLSDMWLFRWYDRTAVVVGLQTYDRTVHSPWYDHTLKGVMSPSSELCDVLSSVAKKDDRTFLCKIIL